MAHETVEPQSHYRMKWTLTLCLFLFICYLVLTWARLRHIPGPFLAKFTNLQRLYWVKTLKAHDIHLNLHRRYGKIVRFGPNMVSVCDAGAIPIIYGFDGRFKKSDLYAVFRPYSRTKVITGMIAQQDEEYHKMLRKPFATIYSARSLESVEDLVTKPIEIFLDQLERQSTGKDGVDLGFWLQLCVWDILCNLTFSKRFGFLDSGKDVDEMLAKIWKQFQDGAPISQMPWYDYVWRKNPILLQLMPGFRMTPIVPFALGQIKQRRDLFNEKGVASNSDFLDRFLAAQRDDPGVPDWAILTWTLGGLGAGGDTSVNVIRGLLYELLANQATLKKLESDVGKALQSDRKFTWRDIRALPYMDACIKEAARMHPPIGLPLERVVPPGGTVVSGKSIPAGTVIGINAYVINRDPTIFGEDANVWRPERWLCSKQERSKMEQGLFTFGAGHRVCPGQYLFDLIVSRMIFDFVICYKAELVDPEKPLSIENSWLMRQSGLRVRVERKVVG